MNKRNKLFRSFIQSIYDFQSFLMIHGRNIDNLNISMIVKISLKAQVNKIETQNISLKSKISYTPSTIKQN